MTFDSHTFDYIHRFSFKCDSM